MQAYRIASFLIILGLAACDPAAEREPDTQTPPPAAATAVQACNLAGYVAAAEGVVVQGLSPELEITRLPAESIVTITGSSAGRLRIVRAVSVEEETLFTVHKGQGAGWIAVGYLVTGTEPASEAGPGPAPGVPVFAGPDGAELDRLTPYDAVNILGCRADWAYIEGTSMEGEAVQGWLAPDAQCPNPVSSCS